MFISKFITNTLLPSQILYIDIQINEFFRNMNNQNKKKKQEYTAEKGFSNSPPYYKKMPLSVSLSLKCSSIQLISYFLFIYYIDKASSLLEICLGGAILYYHLLLLNNFPKIFNFTYYQTFQKGITTLTLFCVRN